MAVSGKQIMTQDAIKQKIIELQAEIASFHPEAFKEKLYCAYRTQLLEQLEGCKSAKDFQIVLANNWSLVKGTALCYTARPDDALTRLLRKIAKSIGKELNIAPIHLLMPDVVTESIYSDKDSAYQHYPNLTGVPLKKILQTHILSDSGRYLIPVRTLLEIPGPWDKAQPLPIYYDDFTENPKQYFVTEKELKRLRTHTEHTEALFAAKENYEALLVNSGFLGHLQKLIRALTANSIAGIGTEEIAGNGTYAVLEHFTQYYQSLGAIAQQIPNDLKSSLDQLISIASDPLQYQAATVSQLCIDMRHKALSNLVKKHENALMCIGVDSAQKAQLLSNAQKRFEGNKESLSKLLNNDQPFYAGRDGLGLNQALLDAFKIHPEITSLRSLQDFLSLSPEEIKLIAGNNVSVKAGILQQFPNLEAFLLFCLSTPLEPLAAIISSMGEQLSGKLIHSLQDINNCLVLMDGARLELMVQLLAQRLMAIIPNPHWIGPVFINLSADQQNTVWVTLIKSGDNFCKIFNFLSVGQREVVYETLKEQLPMFVKNGNDFLQLLKDRSPEQTSAICEMFKTQLTTFIQNGCDFGNVLYWLSLKQRDILFEALKTKLPSLIKNGTQFGQALEYLSLEQRNAVYEMFKAQLPILIQGGGDFGSILRYLSQEQRNDIYEVLKMQLPTLIKSGYQFGEALAYLGPEQRTAIYEMFKPKLPTVITSGTDFRDALRYLNLEQRKNVYEALKALLPSLINSISSFKHAISYLSDEQGDQVYEALKAQLPSLINNKFDFASALKYLSPEKCATIFEVLSWQTYSIITTKAKLEEAIESLNIQQRNAVLQAFDKWLATMPRNGRDLGLVLEKMSSDHFRVFCEKSKPLIHNVIKDGENFSQALQKLNVERQTALLAALEVQLPQILKDSDNFAKALQYLSVEQCTVVCEALKMELPAIIANGYVLGEILKGLSPPQRSVVYEVLQSKLPSLIKDGFHFEQALKFLNAEQRSAVFETFKAQLPTLIKSSYDFCQVFTYLNSEQRSTVYETIKAQLPNFINVTYDFILVLIYLSPGQRMEVFHLLKAELIKKIEKGLQLNNLPNILACEECLTLIGFGADETQALQAEISALLESAKEMRDKPFCPNFENRKRSASQMQETDENVPSSYFQKRKKG